jgi:hypothetical protein
MASSISAIIAVAGTLLGSSLTYVFQRRSAERAQAQAFGTLLRSERLAAYSSLAAALANWRRAQGDRYSRLAEDPDSVAAATARTEMFQLRGMAQGALAHVQLVSDNAAVVAAAAIAFDTSGGIHRSADEAEFESRAALSRAAVDNFLRLAATDVQARPGV